MEFLTRPGRVFLSHRGADKPRVRRLAQALRAIGFDPWLDEDELPAGAPLERRLDEGMAASCAAVFFVSANYADAGFLQTEIDYALAARRARAWFTLIPLVDRGVTAPTILAPFVRKVVESDLDALCEILDALPIKAGTIRWRDGGL